jgi:peptidoglycan/LPS O-acetylase OafA/YrhL
MDRIPHSLSYRPDIDGLRAIAVLSVVFYHAGLGSPGGYVGVDVFFVVSGYLITSLILKDLERGSFSMVNFWERRIRRIFPALAVMVAVTMVAGWFLLLPDDLSKLGASAIAQSLMVSNFYFWRTTNYFGGANEEKPLLHTWSLAVEEQFYLIFPIALMAFWWAWTRWQKNKPDRIQGTKNHTNLHEKVEPPIPPIDTDKNKEAGASLAGQAGSAFSNPSASELARACENISPIRSANNPASSLDINYTPPATAPVALALDSRPSSLDSSSPATSHSLPATALLCDADPSTLDSGLSTHPIDNHRWSLFWIFAAVALLSFALSIWGVKAQPFATFFLLPTRAWELLLGSMMAVLPAVVVVRSVAQRDILCLAGLAGIFLPVFLYGEETSFPGMAALPPCLGTATLIWANSHSSAASRSGWIVKVLSWKPIVFIGLISYSLYLWHWPVICYSSYWAVSEFTAMEKWGIVLASVFFAAASWKLVETPFRTKQIISSERQVLATGVFVSLALGLIGWWGFVSDRFSQRVAPEIQVVLEDLKKDKIQRQKFSNLAQNISDVSRSNLSQLPRVGIQDRKVPCSFVILGDSHAQVAIELFDEIARKHQKSGVAITYQGTPPLLEWNIKQQGGSPNPEELWRAAFEYIKEENVKNVFLLGYWSSYNQSEISRRTVETLERFSNAGIKAWILVGAPNYPQNVARMHLRNIFFRRGDFNGRSGKEFEMENSRLFGEVRRKFPNQIIDSTSSLLAADGIFYRIELNNRLLYFDNNHLTKLGNEVAFLQDLELIFSKMNTDLHQ